MLICKVDSVRLWHAKNFYRKIIWFKNLSFLLYRFFQIREAISKKSMHINIRMFKMNQYTTSENTHFFVTKQWIRWWLRFISNFSYKNSFLFLFAILISKGGNSLFSDSDILLMMGNLIPEITYWRKYVRII